MADRSEDKDGGGAAGSSRRGRQPRVVVDLPPAPTPEVPEEEQALTIDDSTIDPTGLAHRSSATRSVSVGGRSSRSVAAGASSRGRALTDGSSRDYLSSERLLEPSRQAKRAPEGGIRPALYHASFRLINLGDSPRVRARKELDEAIRADLGDDSRFVPVLSRKGGVGKTTVTTLLGMALADAREDRVVAIDANPDRGTLAERITQRPVKTVRDLIEQVRSIQGFTDLSHYVSRDETRLDVIASDTDPSIAQAFGDDDYDVVAELAQRYYSLVLTDCGTGIVHSVMRSTLRRADAAVIVSGGSVDEVRLASETLTWLETNGHEELVANAVVALNTATQGTHMVNLAEVESHFRSRVRDIVRIPYDPQLAAGSTVSFHELQPLTRYAARCLARLVVDGLAADAEPA